MGKVSDFIKQQVERQLKERGVVVWYDPASDYESVVAGLDEPGLPLLRYEDSFLKLKRDLQPFLEFVDEAGLPRHECGVPPRLLVYVPLDRRETDYALIEADCAGAVLEPGASDPERNTRLRVIAEQVFKTISPDQANQIGQKVDDGIYKLADLDKLSDTAIGGSIETLVTIYDTANPDEVILLFLSSPSKDREIEEKQALPEMLGLFRRSTGCEIEATDQAAIARKRVRSRLLISEFLSAFPGETRPSAWSAIPVSPEPIHMNKIRELVSQWRNRKDLRESYKEAASAVELEMRVGATEFAVEQVAGLETFPAIEKRLLARAEDLLLQGEPAKARELARRRKNSFWALESPEFTLRWSLLDLMASLALDCARIEEELRKLPRRPSSLVAAYAEGEDAWCELDRKYRHLETQYAAFDLELGGEHERLSEVVTRTRQLYSETVRNLIEAFTGAVEEHGLERDEALRQQTVFADHVSPPIKEGRKTAYVLMDSLRFEMGREVIEGLAGDFAGSIFPALAQPPTITPVGMAALLPEADAGLKIEPAPGGKIQVSIGSLRLKSRSDRLKYFSETFEGGLFACKLNQLIKPTKKCRDEIKRADLVLVTSQEIDAWGEEADGEVEVRQYMDGVIERLRKGIRRLARLGVTDIVVSADHGHLFGESMEGGMKMDPPGGETVELHRRVWIGRGGAAGEGYLRLKSADLGLGGDLEFAFPRSLACFKAGGSATYMHGGLSLQETVIPVLCLKPQGVKPEEIREAMVRLEFARSAISTRFFSITATYGLKGFFGPDEIRVKFEVTAGRREVGRPAMAASGFEESTGEITLKKDEPNPITIMLTETEGLDSVDVRVLDAGSQVELGSIGKIPANISI